MNRAWTTLPRSLLPRPTVPMMNECIDSYLARLASANRLDADALRSHITGHRSKHAAVSITSLAAFTGQPEHSLRYAICELRTSDSTAAAHLAGRPDRHDPKRASCRACAAARGHTGHPSCHSHHEDAICLKHQRWLGNGIDLGGEQLDLSVQPVIVGANLAHRRLARKHGRAVTGSAYRLAHQVCHTWGKRLERQEQFSDLVTALRPGKRSFAFNDPAVHAAMYPQMVAVTEILASRRWHALAHEQWDRPEQLLRDLWRTARPNPYRRSNPQPRPDEPLINILFDDRHQPERTT